MSRLWRWALPGYLFTLPMTMVGFVLCAVFYRAHSWAWHDGVLTCVGGVDDQGVTRIWGRPNAQTLGWIQVYDTAYMRTMPDLRVHENVHVVQSFRPALWCSLPFVLPVFFGWFPWWAPVVGGLIGGVGFSLGYGFSFLYHWLRGGRRDWYYAYMAIPYEVEAYAAQDAYIANPGSKPWGA